MAISSRRKAKAGIRLKVHPPAAAVQLFLLARVIRYRRGTLAERKEGLRLLRGLMLDHFPRLFPGWL